MRQITDNPIGRYRVFIRLGDREGHSPAFSQAYSCAQRHHLDAWLKKHENLDEDYYIMECLQISKVAPKWMNEETGRVSKSGSRPRISNPKPGPVRRRDGGKS